jgi:diphthine synthase
MIDPMVRLQNLTFPRNFLSLSKPTHTAKGKNTVAIGVARIGSDGQTILAGTLEELLTADFGGPLHSLVIPGSVHEAEAEMAKLYAINPSTFTNFIEIQK